MTGKTVGGSRKQVELIGHVKAVLFSCCFSNCDRQSLVLLNREMTQGKI